MSEGARRAPGEAFAEWLHRRTMALRERSPERISPEVAPEFKQAGVLAAFWPVEDRVELALTLRTSKLSSHRGQISLPGGRLEPGESRREAALRETEEELGIPAPSVDVVARLDDGWSVQGYLVTPFVGWLPSRPRIVPSPDEVERVILADVERLMSPEIHRAERFDGRGVVYDIHYYDYDGDVVWGLTGGILHRLFSLLNGEDGDRTDGEHTLRRFLTRGR